MCGEGPCSREASHLELPITYQHRGPDTHVEGSHHRPAFLWDVDGSFRLSPLRTPAFPTRPIGASQPGLVLTCMLCPASRWLCHPVPQACIDLTPHWALSDFRDRHLWYLPSDVLEDRTGSLVICVLGMQ